MSNFPKLTPAFTTHIVLDPAVAVGGVSKGGPLTVAPFASSSGFLRSEPGYPVKVNAEMVHGSDFIRGDPSGKHVRLDVNSVLKDSSGAFISYKYSGIIELEPGNIAVLSGSKDAKTTEFGHVLTHILFETGSEDLKLLEQKVYVGSGRFIIEEGKAPVVEYKISEVTA